MGDMADLYDLYDPFYWDDEDDGPFGGGWREIEYGPGECPECGAPTRLVTTGPHGPFFGCSKWPKCRGSRQAEPEEINRVGNVEGVHYANGARLPYSEYERRPRTLRRAVRKAVASARAACGRVAKAVGRKGRSD